jgi:hypothetical protein
MNEAADSLEAIGFIVSDRTEAAALEKIVGYKPVRSPARFALPDQKTVQLSLALNHLVSTDIVHTGDLHSVLGLWIWGSLLRRDLLSIPYTVFSFIQKLPKQRVRWWPVARQEIQMIAYLLPLVFADIGASLCSTVFATDAMGANEQDNGGYGVVCADVSSALIQAIYTRGRARGFTVSRLSGDLSGLKYPSKETTRTVPFSLLPKKLFDKKQTPWKVIMQGRWKHKDHITLGEGRAVMKMLRAITPIASLHRSKIHSLQDNMPIAGVFTKGRSAAPSLMYLARMKAAHCLAAGITLILPWVQTTVMPADDSSRVL